MILKIEYSQDSFTPIMNALISHYLDKGVHLSKVRDLAFKTYQSIAYKYNLALNCDASKDTVTVLWDVENGLVKLEVEK